MGRPTPGYRPRDSGTLYGVGRAGYGWLSSVPAGSSNAHDWSFSEAGVGPQNNHNRAYGFQVRCLLE